MIVLQEKTVMMKLLKKRLVDSKNCAGLEKGVLENNALLIMAAVQHLLNVALGYVVTGVIVYSDMQMTVKTRQIATKWIHVRKGIFVKSQEIMLITVSKNLIPAKVRQHPSAQ